MFTDYTHHRSFGSIVQAALLCHCRWGYHTVQEVEQVVANYSAAGIPLEVEWMDIDYMNGYRDFTLDPVNFPQEEVAAFLSRCVSRFPVQFVRLPWCLDKVQYNLRV